MTQYFFFSLIKYFQKANPAILEIPIYFILYFLLPPKMLIVASVPLEVFQ